MEDPFVPTSSIAALLDLMSSLARGSVEVMPTTLATVALPSGNGGRVSPTSLRTAAITPVNAGLAAPPIALPSTSMMTTELSSLDDLLAAASITAAPSSLSNHPASSITDAVSFIQITIPSEAAAAIFGLPTPPTTSPPTNLPGMDATSVLPAEAAMTTTPPLADGLQSLGEEMVSNMVNALVQLISLLASRTAEPATIPMPTSTASEIEPEVLPSIASTSVILVAIPASPSSSSASSETQDFTNRRRKPAPQLPGFGFLGGLLPGARSKSAGVSTSSVSLDATIPSTPVETTGQTSSPLPGRPVVADPSIAAPAVPQVIPSPAAQIVGMAPIVGNAALYGSPGTMVMGVIASIPIPSDLPTIIQGVKDAAVSNLATSVTNIPLLGQTSQVLAILQLLGVMNLGQFGSVATLTNLPAVQSAALLINEPDLVTLIYILRSKSIIQSTAADGLLDNVVGFVQMVEYLLPLVSNIKTVVAVLISQQLGVAGLDDIINGV
ncbi:uncharacterized protein LTR77_001947 [Saxophila tyrrhenica]|uniref:Uncharacterized protein n=1 Tax=Saxophila tyrrhenica TaxID=1690608 RepID=A0AAV9PM07_9PEZI|nr:hypothetical protein LTR77_001947 [Saxophila tyrrhenica]